MQERDGVVVAGLAPAVNESVDDTELRREIASSEQNDATCHAENTSRAYAGTGRLAPLGVATEPIFQTPRGRC